MVESQEKVTSKPSDEQTDFTPDADADSIQGKESAPLANAPASTSSSLTDEEESLTESSELSASGELAATNEPSIANSVERHRLAATDVSAEAIALEFEVDSEILSIPETIEVLESTQASDVEEQPDSNPDGDSLEGYEVREAFQLTEADEISAGRSLPEIELPTQEEFALVESISSPVPRFDYPSRNTNLDNMPLVDELGIHDLTDPIAGGRGRLFAAAGRDSPIAEFTEEALVLYPPQKPFVDPQAEQPGSSEFITRHCDETGILLDEIGNRKKIPGAKFNGNQIYWLMLQKPGTLKHLVGWFDAQGNCHLLYQDGRLIISDEAYKLRNKTHDGELNIFTDLTSD